MMNAVITVMQHMLMMAVRAVVRLNPIQKSLTEEELVNRWDASQMKN